MPLYCIAENDRARTPEALREAAGARGVDVVTLDPLGDWDTATPGAGDAVWRCSATDAAREVELALLGDEVLHPWSTLARARVTFDAPTSALRIAGLPVRPALRVGRRKERDRLRAQVERLGGLPVTLVAGSPDGTPIPIDGLPALFSIVDYLDWCNDPMWLLDGSAWHARREVYVVGTEILGGVDTSSWHKWRRRNGRGPDDALALLAARVLGLRFARVVLSWDAQARPHVVDAGFPAEIPGEVLETTAQAIVRDLVRRGLR